MKQLIFYSAFLIFILSGCSVSHQAVPVSSPGAIINDKAGSITMEKDSVEITVSLADWNNFPYNLTNYFIPFDVAIRNKTQEAISLDTNNFFVYDENQTQYNAYTSKDVYSITSGELYYLIPYPYVGVYMFEGYRQYPTIGYREYPPIGVAGPQLYEVYPRDVFSQAMTFGTLNPEAGLKGLVYFKGNAYDMKKIRLVITPARPDGRKSTFEFLFEMK